MENNQIDINVLIKRRYEELEELKKQVNVLAELSKWMLENSVTALKKQDKELAKQVSTFATIGKAGEEGDDPFSGLDESKMERAFESLMWEADGINEDDPKQMASLMRKFTDQTGVRLGDSMEEALSRMESGEDPEQVEKEMGDLLSEDDFSFESVKKRVLQQRPEPAHDDTLYKL